jgi:hypothetical protein
MDVSESNIINLFNQFINYFLNYSHKLDNNLVYSIANMWDGNLIENFHINVLGNIIYTNYFI